MMHEAVEAVLLPRLTSIQSSRDYAAILAMFYGYFQPLESSIQHYITPTRLPDIRERRTAGAVLHDLAAIGHDDEPLPLCESLPVIENTAQAFGALYVLEGSTLGGKMIAKMLLKNAALNITPGALSFFSGYKEETGSKWKAFLEALNKQEEPAQVVQAANETFYHLKGWMQQQLPS